MRKTTTLLLCLLAILLASCQTGPAFTSLPATPTLAGLFTPAELPTPTDLGGPFATSMASSTPFSPPPTPNPTGTLLPTVTPPPTSVPPLRFAVIGDYGAAGEGLAGVAALVKSWNPDLVITVGDNNYPSGAENSIDRNIGQYFSDYISPYHGQFGPGAVENRFFPTLGNHDWDTPGAKPYLDYFTLPGNERYYDFTWGPVHFFALDSDSREPDGVSSGSAQAEWLKERLAAATEPWKIVYFHHAPYSSGLHGSVDWMRWPFKEWGASAVLSGHDHTYERLLVDGLPYFVNGLGGGGIYHFTDILDSSQVRYNDDYGAMLVEASQTALTFQFINRSGTVIDSYSLNAGKASQPPSQASVPAAPLDQSLALLPAAQGDLAALPGIPLYTLQIALNYAERTFSGHEQLDYTNLEEVPLEQLYLRLFPNGGRSYGDGSLTVASVSVDGQPAGTKLSLADTVLEVQLPKPLPPTGHTQVQMDFAGVVPEDFGGGRGYGIYNYSQGLLALANWYPILAVYNSEGWNLDSVSYMGDSVFSDTSLFTVDVTAQADLVLAATGLQTDQEAQGSETRYRFISGPTRDFFLIASPDLQKASQVIDGTQVNSYYLPGHEEGGKVALEIATGALQIFNRMFGPYPFTELDVVDGPMNNASGVEYPGIVLISTNNYDEPTDLGLGITVSHEVAHQWWYSVVGNDVIDEPWLDEALATYSSTVYYEQARGERFFQGFVDSLENRYKELLDSGGNDRITRGLPYFESVEEPRSYGGVVYNKGALFFQLVRQAMGDDAFFAALQDYFAKEKYGIAQAHDLLGAFQSASSQSLDSLYQEWLYSP